MLTELDLSCNRFRHLPQGLAKLPQLVTLNASKNYLQPNTRSLLIAGLKQLTQLCVLDLRFNAKCGQQELLDMLSIELPTVIVRITLWGQFVGISPSTRDATSGLLLSLVPPLPPQGQK